MNEGIFFGGCLNKLLVNYEQICDFCSLTSGSRRDPSGFPKIQGSRFLGVPKFEQNK